MVRAADRKPHGQTHSPRIRGDGPIRPGNMFGPIAFSPYSRGWSRTQTAPGKVGRILPVFAGMVPGVVENPAKVKHSPRIRGDGPAAPPATPRPPAFSPYSRGWSLIMRDPVRGDEILPVFAGMVPLFHSRRSGIGHSPRIRGDGPAGRADVANIEPFSPYSRGWSPSE